MEALFVESACSSVLLPGIRKGTVRLYFPRMSPKRTEPFYELYRNLPGADQSLALLFQKLDQSPENPRLLFELGEAAHQAGVLQLSVECYSKVTVLVPHVEAGFFNLGNAFFDLRQFNDARQAYERAFKLNPDCGTLNNLGNSFAAMEDWEKAIQTFDRALSLADCSPMQKRTALSNRGKVLVAVEDWDGAIENYRQAIQWFPDDIEFLALKAKCHGRKFEFGKGVECLVEALVASPNNPELLCQIADLNFGRGRTLESLLCMNNAFTILPPPAALRSRRLQMLTYCVPATPDRILSEATGWANSQIHDDWFFTAEPTISASERNIGPPSDQALRVGILCSALPSRGLSDWLPACLSQCAPARLQWFIYCDQSVPIETKNALVRAGCRLEETSSLSDKALASQIKAHQLAVLIDMIGHGHSSRLQVAARKPAQVQVTWCAFPMTSGLTQMDFIWSDPVSIPEESEKFFSEKVIRFSVSSFCFQPSCSIDLRIEINASDSRFCCGFLGEPEQISEPFVQTLRLLFKSIPGLELVFTGQAYRDPAFQSEIRERIEEQPMAISRIRFECFESAELELNSYQQFDVTLDPFLVSSPQRSFESLWMGVPVVTLLDERLSGRGTASILDSLNRKAWIANNQNDYVHAVKQLAECRSERRSQRAELRSELLTSPMCNIALIAKNIQRAIDETIRQTNFATKTR